MKTIKLGRFRKARFCLHVAIFLMCIVGGSVRLPPMLADLWLDEIWSLGLAGSADSLVDILTKLHHDNNHWLNTAFMYLLGDGSPEVLYRLPSLIAGISSIILAGWIARKRGQLESLTASSLFALSYLQILYSTEARGYGLAVFFSLVAFQAIDRFIHYPTWKTCSVFWLASALGFLSHLTFAHSYLALLFWLGYQRLRYSHRSVAFADMLKCYGIPTLILGCLYWFDIRHMQIGGGPKYALVKVLAETLSLTYGSGQSGIASMLTALLAITIIMLGLVMLYREGADRWAFFVAVILLSPGLMIILARPQVLFPRYFLIPSSFALILTSYLLCSWYRTFRFGKAIYVIFLSLILFANTNEILHLWKYGRGHYSEAIAYLAEHTDGRDIVLTSDHDFRNSMILDYYSRYLPPGKRIIYSSAEQMEEYTPEWLITHHQARNYQPPQTLTISASHLYRLAREYRYSNLSGWHWFIYRRENSHNARPDNTD